VARQRRIGKKLGEILIASEIITEEHLQRALDFQRAEGGLLGEGVKAHKAVGCRGFSRVDMKVTDRGDVFILEVNTIPGMTERSLLPMAARESGLDFSKLCIKMLSMALKNRPD